MTTNANNKLSYVSKNGIPNTNLVELLSIFSQNVSGMLQSELGYTKIEINQ